MNEEESREIQQTTSQFNSWINFITRISIIVLQQSLIISFIVSSILWLAILVYASFLYFYLPDAVLERPVYFQFRLVSERITTIIIIIV